MRHSGRSLNALFDIPWTTTLKNFSAALGAIVFKAYFTLIKRLVAIRSAGLPSIIRGSYAYRQLEL